MVINSGEKIWQNRFYGKRDEGAIEVLEEMDELSIRARKALGVALAAKKKESKK